MKYMLMLIEPDTDWPSLPKEQLEAGLAGHTAFAKYLEEQGIEFSGAALRPSTTATTLRPDNTDVIITDGPYVDLKENLAGFYIIDVENLDQALEVAKRCPMGTATEVRPVWEM